MAFAPFIPAAVGAGAGLLEKLFGGGGSQEASKQMQRELEQAEQQIQQATGQGLGLLSPFQQAGAGAIPQLQGMLGQDPTQIVNRIQGQFQKSPGFQFQSKEAQDAMQNQLAAAGLTGSGAAIQGSGQLASNLAQQGQQQFLQNVLGQRQQQMGGLESLFGGGLSAAQSGAGLLGQEGQSLAGLTGQIGQTQAAGTLGKQQDLSSLFGGMGQLGGLVGGSGGMGNLFGGGNNPLVDPDTGMPFASGGFAPSLGF